MAFNNVVQSEEELSQTEIKSIHRERSLSTSQPEELKKKKKPERKKILIGLFYTFEFLKSLNKKEIPFLIKVIQANLLIGILGKDFCFTGTYQVGHFNSKVHFFLAKLSVNPHLFVSAYTGQFSDFVQQSLIS